MDTVSLTIDGRQVEVAKGATVLHAAQQAGISIPTLCYHADLSPFGACRLCVVEVENMRGFPPACTTPVSEGMVVHTDTPRLQKLRRSTLELILSEHPYSCLTCPKNLNCELQDVARRIGLEQVSLPSTFKQLPVDRENPFFDRDYNLCILCGRCVRMCQEVRGTGAIAFVNRGSETLVGTAFDHALTDTNCEFCAACVDACPTGALIDRAERWQGNSGRDVTTTCPYCGVGCQITLRVNEDHIVTSKPANGPANHGQVCVKGRFGIAQFVHHSDRLTSPLIKRNGTLERASWDEALELVATRLGSYAAEELAVISSAKCTNEENYLVQKFARAVLGTNSVDHCARLCHAPTVAGLVQTFGSGAMTNSIGEIGDAACVLAIGTNTTETHPVTALEVKRAVRNGARLIVANPREIDLCRFASHFLQHRPGTDVALLMGMMRVIVEEGLADREFVTERCENFDAFRESLEQFDPSFVERITDVPWEKIAEAARTYATARPATTLYAMGITQHSHGTDNVMAVANLAMLTGNVGKPSTGVNPLRGQNNVQGACDLGALPNVYSGYQAVTNPAIREKFEEAWGTSLPSDPGLTVTEMFASALQGKVRAMYLVGENPALSDPDLTHVREALARLDFLVVQDIFLSETAEFAHVVLPAASFAEKDGTFTNTERRVQRVRKAIEPIGDSRPDWWITSQIARRMGGHGFGYSDPFDIQEEIRSLTPSYGGISYQRLEDTGLQWPCPTDDHPGTPILHVSNFVRGKGRFIPLSYLPPKEQPDEEYPLILTTGRTLYHFHTGTMTRRVEDIHAMQPWGTVEISPEDAARLGVRQGEMVKVSSRRGELTVRARVTDASPWGVVFMAFHFSESPANVLTNPELDPTSKIPELKVAAVRIDKLGAS
ncbi:MAG: formate dehydrogenase subunit alpha [Chloroflexota bacterium]